MTEQEEATENLAHNVSAGKLRNDSRLFELFLVLLVSLGQPILASIYFLRGGTAPLEPLQQEFRIWGALIAESGSLLLLSYVLRQRHMGWEQIGWGFRTSDFAKGVGLFSAGYLGALVAVVVFQYSYRASTGHFRIEGPLQLGLTLSPMAI